jgi:hypothetical protein
MPLHHILLQSVDIGCKIIYEIMCEMVIFMQIMLMNREISKIFWNNFAFIQAFSQLAFENCPRP